LPSTAPGNLQGPEAARQQNVAPAAPEEKQDDFPRWRRRAGRQPPAHEALSAPSQVPHPDCSRDGGSPREGTGDAKEGAHPVRLTCQPGRAHSARAESHPGSTPPLSKGPFCRRPQMSRLDPGFRPCRFGTSHDPEAESGAGRHVTARRRRLMTQEPALDVSAIGKAG
jgi:hypothetical protein